MVAIPSLWLPILLFGVFVFVGSSIIHMFLPYQRNDFRKLPDEDGVIDALRPLNVPPGDYVMPHAGGGAELKSDTYRTKLEKSPLAVMTVLPQGSFANMGPQLAQWFAYCLIVAAVVAYVAGRTLVPGADYLAVFRLSGTVAFACYAVALPKRSIWYRQNSGRRCVRCSTA